jgi:hypothetical protein
LADLSCFHRASTAAADAFTEVERQRLYKIVPHPQCALKLRERLALETRANNILSPA